MIRILLISLVVCGLTFTAVPVFAAEATFFGPIIAPECNCEADGTISAPDWGCVLQTVQNTINLAISLSVIIATLFIVYTGFMFVASAGNPRTREQAKTRLMNVVVGMLVVLSAWLVVDFIMKTLYGEEGKFGPWNAILQGEGDDMCIKQAEPPPPLPAVTAVPGQTTGGTGGVTGSSGCPTCVSLSALGISCKTASSCTLDPRVAQRVVNLKNNFNGTWTVTEAYPPTVRHTNPCHNQGTCLDLGFRGSTTYNAANIKALSDAAGRSGFRAVFETGSCSLRDAARAQGVEAFCSSDRGYGHIRGNHFSLYAR